MDLRIFLEQVPDDDVTWAQMLLSGLEWTLAVAFIAWIVAFVLGSLIGIIRTTDKPWLVRLGGAYVELFRNIPLLVQFFLWYYVVPDVIPGT
jgi:glutamate/aspartate transport system permease protein